MYFYLLLERNICAWTAMTGMRAMVAVLERSWLWHGSLRCLAGNKPFNYFFLFCKEGEKGVREKTN